MSPETTDLDWVAEQLPDVPAPDGDATDLARVALMEHLSAATPIKEPASRRRPTRSRRVYRRPLSLGLVAVAAGAAAVVAVNVGTSGHGSVTPASAATILAHTRTALDVPGGQVLEYTTSDSQGNTMQMAMDASSPQDWSQRATFGTGQPELVDGQEDGMREFYDEASNTIYRGTDSSDAVGLSDGDQGFLTELDAPGAQVSTDQNATLNGQPATTITSTQTGYVYELWVDPSNGDRPLQFTKTPTSGATVTTTWSGYQTVSASSPSPAQLTDLYPSATITTLSHAAFVAQETQDNATGTGVTAGS